MAKMFEITANQLQELAQERSLQLIDIREPHEYAAENIAGAISMPLSAFDLARLNQLAQEKSLVFHCLSGMRTMNNAALFAQVDTDEAFILSGGLNGWKACGMLTNK